ncbi:hypothetical protein FK178_03905 [Antarcticibacterium arcticum]|uniref:ATP/GTP-binding protein n=1 Tax=Antarcticibacterium arcticum TaxID=2585771 RepID=A0A5B8YJ90_9FLAO|nr:hypothetical protein [Antarcticibacterium arcticum]QED36907.1 hypothetical protein FK178_03905 [Antarcticibacterium arcticum]
MHFLPSKIFIFILFFSPVITVAQNYNSKLLHKVEGFSHPESVVFDPVHNTLLVSNIGEKEPGDGFISRLGLDGQIISTKWVEGLNDPKGLLLLGNKLYVTDNTDLVIIDNDNAEIIERIPVEGAGFLNDIAEGPEGSLFISDTRNSSIYKRETSGKVTEWLNTPQLENPNGLLVVGNYLHIAAWGSEGAGNVLRVNLDTKEINNITNSGVGNLDGIQLVEQEDFFVSDWATGKIFYVSKEKAHREVLTSAKSAGDILYLKNTKQIVVPMNIQNEVWWYQLD